MSYSQWNGFPPYQQMPWGTPMGFEHPKSRKKLIKEALKERERINAFIKEEMEKEKKGKDGKPKEDNKPKAPTFNLLETMALVFLFSWLQSVMVPLIPHIVK